MDFDTASDGGSFASNTIFGNGNGSAFQRYDAAAGGVFGSNGVNVNISVESFYNRSGEIDLAVGFDSSLTGTRDRDLEDDFSTIGNADEDGYRNILIVQSSENWFTRSCANNPGSGGVCDDNRADDEGRGGKLIFDFETAVDLIGMNIFDIESNQAGKVYLFDVDGDQIGSTLMMPTTGDRGVGFMDFGGVAQGVAVMKVKFYGSGAIDNITGDSPFTTPQVPEPATAALLGIGLIGLTALRRRRRKMAA